MDEAMLAALSAKRECAFCSEETFRNGDLINGPKGVMICKRCIMDLARMVATQPYSPPARQSQPASEYRHFPKLADLTRVVAVGQTTTLDGVAVTVLSIELYGDGLIINSLIRASMPNHADDGIHWLLVLDVGSELAIDDGLGGSYVSFGAGGGGNAQEYRFRQTFSPALSAETQTLRLELANLRFVRFDPRDPGDRSRDETRHGPWTFVVPLRRA